MLNWRFAEEREIRGMTKPLRDKNKDSKKTRYCSGPIIYTDTSNNYWVDNGYRHIATFGTTGGGKSRSGSITEAMNAIKAGESVVVCDPKGEHLAILGEHIPANYRKIVIDFTKISSGDCFNVFKYIVYLLRSDSEEDNNLGAYLFETFVDTLFSESKKSGRMDPFWDNNAMSMIRGFFYTMICICDDDEINLVNLKKFINNAFYKMVQDEYDGFGDPGFAEYSICGGKTEELGKRVLRHLRTLDGKYVEVASKDISIFANERENVYKDTLSVASAAISGFMGSAFTDYFHTNDTVDLANIDGTTPIAIFVVLPIETEAFNALGGFIINQFAQQFFRVAKATSEGCLPIRVNFILEEFGAIGKAVPIIMPLVTAGRSFGIRVHMIMQSYSQLVELYGEDNANTLASNCGTLIFFRTRDPKTYNHFEKFFGNRRIIVGNTVRVQPIVSPDALCCLETFQALVAMDNKVFVSRLPQYTEVYSELK